MRGQHILVGLTGNIATGKTCVARILADLGAHVIDADQVAHEVMQPGEPAYRAVIRDFGHEIMAGDGTIDRPKLGEIVFRDPAALRRLEQAVHPEVIAEVKQRITQAPAKVVVIEAIKLLESGMHRDCDAVWVVTAPRGLQIARLMATRDMTREKAVLRIEAQPSQEEKTAVADVIIVNDGDLDALRDQVEVAWAQLS
jgi:dephospho-CoA kinase